MKKAPKIGGKEINAKKGDLVMLIHDSRITDDKVKSIVLGVFDGFEYRSKTVKGEKVENGEPFIILKSPYILSAPKGWGIELTLISLTELKKEIHGYLINARTKEIKVGQEDIVRRLREIEGYSSHADLIGKLEKPYVEK